jgi:hypothetical protein
MSQQARQFAIDSWDERRTLPLMEEHFSECARQWKAQGRRQ